MKRLTALLFAGMLLFSGCSGQESAESTAETETPVYKALPLPELYLEIPERFSVTSSQFYEEYYICEDASIIITQDVEDAPYASVYDYAASALVEYENVTSGMELHNDEMVYAGTVAVQTLEFTYTVGEGEDALSKTCMTGYLTDTDSMYIITCKSDVETYASFRDDFLSVIQSAAFIK